MKGEHVSREVEANVAAAESSTWIPCEDLENISIHVVQRVDASTVTLQVQESPDGALVQALGSTIDQDDFAAAADAPAAAIAFEGANGMPKITKQIRLTATAYGGGEYSLIIAGQKRSGY